MGKLGLESFLILRFVLMLWRKRNHQRKILPMLAKNWVYNQRMFRSSATTQLPHLNVLFGSSDETIKEDVCRFWAEQVHAYSQVPPKSTWLAFTSKSRQANLICLAPLLFNNCIVLGIFCKVRRCFSQLFLVLFDSLSGLEASKTVTEQKSSLSLFPLRL